MVKGEKSGDFPCAVGFFPFVPFYSLLQVYPAAPFCIYDVDNVASVANSEAPDERKMLSLLDYDTSPHFLG